MGVFASRLVDLRGFLYRKIGISSDGAEANDASAALLTFGSGAASASDPNGSLRLRSDGIPEARIGGAWAGVALVSQTPDFSTTGIKADVVAESTSAAGVTVDGLLIKDSTIIPALADPGDAAAIPVTRSASIAFTTGGSGETGTLAIPAYVGQLLSLTLDVDGGGDRVVTAASAINQTGNTIMTFADAGDHITLIGVQVAGAPVWRILANDGVALS